MSKEGEEQDRQVETWKVKKLIKSLQAARGYVFADLTSLSMLNLLNFKYDHIITISGMEPV